jgi:aminopeptidase N
LNIHVAEGQECVANGQLLEVEEKDERRVFHWKQHFESPAYTYGFAIGRFHKFEMAGNEVKINNYARSYSSEELEQIFVETSNMISFFEEKSGVEYDHGSYSQILIGNHFQEMSGFSVLKEAYGKMVLKDSTETNLISHELAHQWWGNRITCKSWNHFWLHEAIATYMSAAYNECRFGKDKYNADIQSYLKVYQDIKNRKKDRSLVFEDWSNPSRDDRNIVYFKGAYVLHLLREEVGDQNFWNGLRYYSQKYFDKLVTTVDFQSAMQEIAGRDLDLFFNEWVY